MRMETSRLMLMSLQFTDANDMFMAVKESIADLEKWFPWVHNGYGLKDARAFIADAVDRELKKNGHIFSIRSRTSGRMLGVVELLHVLDPYGKRVPMYEVGFWTRTSEGGQGYATEALQRVVRYALEELGAKRVFGSMAESNTKARTVLEASGLAYEATLRNHRVLSDGTIDGSAFYATLGKEVKG